jgi:hypothetical protein
MNLIIIKLYQRQSCKFVSSISVHNFSFQNEYANCCYKILAEKSSSFLNWNWIFRMVKCAAKRRWQLLNWSRVKFISAPKSRPGWGRRRTMHKVEIHPPRSSQGKTKSAKTCHKFSKKISLNGSLIKFKKTCYLIPHWCLHFKLSVSILVSMKFRKIMSSLNCVIKNLD